MFQYALHAELRGGISVQEGTQTQEEGLPIMGK